MRVGLKQERLLKQCGTAACNDPTHSNKINSDASCEDTSEHSTYVLHRLKQCDVACANYSSPARKISDLKDNFTFIEFLFLHCAISLRIHMQMLLRAQLSLT